MRNWILGIAVVMAAFSTASARADEEKVALDKVPKAVISAAKAKYPGAKLTEAAKEVEKGKTTYEVSLTTVDKRKIDATFKPDGTLVLTEETIEVKDLPKVVSAAVKAKYPKGKMKSAEKLVEGDEVSYEVVVAIEGKKDIEVVVDPKGKIEEPEDDEKK